MVDIQALEEKVNKIEHIFDTGAKEIVREVQVDILKDLYALRDTLKREIGNPSDAQPVANLELEAEVKKLKEENEKLKYRVEHLKRHIK